MSAAFQQIYDDAIDLLHRLTTPNGILASTIEADNYKRIWSRDSIVCGLAGLMINDEILTGGLKNSLTTLARHQHELGMIPSNVNPENSSDVSFGSLVGRIDATTWFIVGCCSYYLSSKDEKFWREMEPVLQKCRVFLRSIEFNDKGWLYTPLSGNWADEYPVHGYTLYDNMLRIWGESLWNEIQGTESAQFKKLKERTLENFWPAKTMDESNIYQKSALNGLNLNALQHFVAFILPGKYDTRFDAAGNGLAMYLFKLNDHQKGAISDYVSFLSSELNRPLIPAFWPMITPNSEDWNLLEGNYSFSFKNKPGDFHNGGIWPVWMGLFCLGLSRNGLRKEAESIVEAFTRTALEDSKWDFQEFFNARNFLTGGKRQMGYTASGVVFMRLALQ